MKLRALRSQSFDSSSPIIISPGVVAVNSELLLPFFFNQAFPLLAACLVAIVSEILTPSSDNPASVHLTQQLMKPDDADSVVSTLPP